MPPQFATDDNPGSEWDLRRVLDVWRQHRGQLLESRHPVDPQAELAGVYRHIGAGGTVPRPTRIGPAMIFSRLKGYEDGPVSRVLVGAMASRERVGMALDCVPQRLTRRLGEAVLGALPPVVVEDGKVPCQEQVFHADDDGFDLRALLPTPTNTPDDAGPFLCLGLVLGSHPDDPDNSDVTIHRLCVQARDELSIFFAPGRHIDVYRQAAERTGRPLPVSISMGLDPAIYVGSCFEAPTTPYGFDELGVAGALRGAGVQLARCVSIDQYAIARAEIVIEGEILPERRMREDQNSRTGYAMPEFPGYNGEANPSLPVIRVRAVTMRRDAILQTLVGPGEEHTNLAGIPTESSIFNAVERSLPGLVGNVYAHTAGGGKLLAVLQVRKKCAGDEGRERQAALIALGVCRELKNVILVDDDVDIFDSDDVLWAMQTRYQGDVDTIFIPRVTGHVLDPSQTPEYNACLPARGTTCKTIFDCTVPWHMRERFRRAPFAEADPVPFAPELFGREVDSGEAWS
ncbi:MAG TPA: UbiD family decarboxylase [Gammaproteobacteria bacterium]|nr:UbiD family decarboxylase [Gammaproteobacteria bacterium]